MLGSGVASAVGAFTSFGAVAAAQSTGAVPALAAVPLPVGADGPSFELRILGWDRSDDYAALASTQGGEVATWIAIDSQWRGVWR